jgi:hypothetical protein
VKHSNSKKTINDKLRKNKKEKDIADISFYTYAYCIDDETIKNAIEKYDKSVKTYREVNDIE